MAVSTRPNGTATGLRILVVEDFKDEADSMAMWLRMHGHEVQLALDGPAALDAARVDQPDVVLLDLGLPGSLDGWEVANLIRQSSEASGQRRPLLVAVTGHGTDGDRRRSEQAGIDLHLLKPADARQLQHLLNRFRAIIADG
jgi:CheY-like chemotaxis protein